MLELTPNDRGTFLVETQGSNHTWTITDNAVTVSRVSKGGSVHPSMLGFPEAPYVATPQAWPVVGQCFLNVINGGAGDIPWTRSSTVKSITRLA